MILTVDQLEQLQALTVYETQLKAAAAYLRATNLAALRPCKDHARALLEVLDQEAAKAHASFHRIVEGAVGT